MIFNERPLNGGHQTIHKFDNGYGASVITGGMFAYGGQELAVIKFKSEDEWSICYDTEITDDVIGCISDEEVEDILSQIEAL